MRPRSVPASSARDGAPPRSRGTPAREEQASSGRRGYPLRWLVDRVLSGLERRLFGLTADEIRYTIEDVRSELRASRAELRAEIAALRSELERMTLRHQRDERAPGRDPE